MASNKRVDVTLGFTADTNKIKKQLQDLQKQLNSLITSPTQNPIGISKEIEQASVAAATLKTQLENATNVDTGMLDLGKFTRSLKQSGYELKDYKAALSKLGLEGNKAFTSLAKSIMYAEAPLKKTNAMLDRFAKTFKSVVSWQISSNVLNLFTGTLSDAYSYAKSLDASLNSIRIVTGKTTEQMTSFAEEANKAARSLSTTTTAYTDASLIFFQQGLPEAEVKSRTDAVIKMSNVTGEAAADVSSYMTAIWNNFAKGNKDLESFADTITALGAATASSTKEIAGGLEKFSAVANQIGLSYEYATTALATVVARTRQSEDIVGTAFKTIFARLQSLKLGETLDDNTSLTKYSQALASVGVSIKDTNGELKSMDDILDDLGGKWDNLSRAQQTALAQTVAGQRQYNQFIALMDSWNTDFQKNLAIANNSEGALQEQADIYAESWEAAHKRVTSAWQGLYDELIDEKFFISIENGIAGLIDVVNNFVKGLGGVQGVLLSLGSVLTNIFAKQGASAIDGFLENMYKISSKGKEEMLALKKETNNLLTSSFDWVTYGGYQNTVKDAYTSTKNLQETLMNNADIMSEQQKRIAQSLLEQHDQLVENVEEYSRIAIQAERVANKSINDNKKLFQSNDGADIENYYNKVRQTAALEAASQNFIDILPDPTSETYKEDIEKYKASLKTLKDEISKVGKTEEQVFGEKGKGIIDKFSNTLENPIDSAEELQEALNEVYNSIENINEELNTEAKGFFSFDSLNNAKQLEKSYKRVLDIYNGSAEKNTKLTGTKKDIQFRTDNIQNFKNEIQKIKQEIFKDGGTLEGAFGKEGATIFNDIEKTLSNGKMTVKTYKEAIQRLNEAVNKYVNDTKKSNEAAKERNKQFKDGANKCREAGEAIVELAYANTKLEKSNKSVENFFDNLKKQGLTAGKTIMTITSSVTALMSAYKAFNNITEVSQQLAEGQIDSFEGLSQIFTSLSFVLPNVISNFKKVFDTIKLAGASTLKASLITGGYVVVILGLIKGIEYLIKLYQKFKTNSPEGQLKTAREEAAKLATELENTNAKAEEVKNTFDTYTEIKKNLDECTKGTKEWYEALEKANNNALELIKQFPQLLTMVNEVGESAITFNAETGNTEVAEWALEKIVADAQKQNAIVQFASIQANKDVLLKQLEVEKNNIIKNYSLLESLTEQQQTTFLNKYSQSKYQFTNKDDLVNQLYNDLFEANGVTQEGYLLDLLKEQYAEEIGKLADNIINNLASFNDRLKDINKATETQNKAYLTSLIRNNNDAKNSPYINQITNAIANGFNNYKPEEIDFSKITDEVRDKFIKYVAPEADKDSSVILNKNNQIKYKVDGKWAEPVDIKTATLKIQSAEALEVAEANIPQVTEIFNKLYNSPSNISKNIAEFIGKGNLEELSSKEIFSNIFNVKEKDFKLDLKFYGLNDELLNQLGYTAKELLKSLQQNVIDYKIAERNIKEKLITQKSKTSYDFLLEQRKSLNLKEQESLVNILNKTSAYGGKEATTNTGLLFNKFSGEQLKTFLNNVSTFDWNSIDVKAFKENLAELGIEVQLEDKIIQSFVSSMRLTTSQTIKTIQENYATKKKIVDSLNIFGSISAEDFEKLGKDFKDFFIELEDGSYALIKSSEELKGKLEQLQRVSLQSFYDEKSKEYEILSKASNGNSKASTQDDAKAKLDIILSFANGDKEIENKVAEFREKLENNTGLDEITNYFNDFVGKLDISEGLEKQREELRTTAISLILLSENTEKAIREFSEAEWITNDDIDYIRNYLSLQEESSDRIQEIIKYSKELAKIVPKDNLKQGETYEILAKKILDANDAVKDIKDNFETWKNILNSEDATSNKYITTLENFKEAIHNLYGIDKKIIDTDFIQQNLGALEKLSKGDTSVELTYGSAKIKITQKDYLNIVAYNEELDKYAKYLQSIYKDKSYEEVFNIARQVSESNEAIKNLTDNFESWNKTLNDKSKKGTKEYQEALDGIKTAIKTLYGIELDEPAILNNLGKIVKIVNGDFTVAINNSTMPVANLLNKLEKLIPPIIQTTQEYLYQEEVLKNLNKEYENLNKQKSIATEQDQINILKQQNKLLEEQASVYKSLGINYKLDLVNARKNIEASKFKDEIKFNDNGSIDLASYQEYAANEQNRINQITNANSKNKAQEELNNFKETIQGYIDIWNKSVENSESLADIEYEKLQNIIEIKEIEIKIKLDTEEAEEKLENLRQGDYDRLLNYKNKELENIQKQIDNSTSYKEKKTLIKEAQNKVSDIAKETNKKYSERGTAYKATGINLSVKTSEQYQRELNAQKNIKLSALEGMDINSEEYQTKLLEINNWYTQESNKIQEAITLYEEMNNIREDIIKLQEKNLDLTEQDKQLKTQERQKYIDAIKNAGSFINSFDFSQFRAEGSKNYKLAQAQVITGGTLNTVGNVFDKMNSEEFKGFKFGEKLSAVSDIIADGVKNMMEDAQEKYMAKIDQVLDNWDKLGEKFQTLLNSLDHYTNVAELLYGPNSDKTKELKKSANEAKITTSLGNMERQKVEQQKLTQQLSYMKEGDEGYEKVKTQLDELNAEMEQSIESHLQLVKEQYALAVTEIMDNFEREMTGGDTLSKISERWQDSQELAKGYYDEVEKIYQLESLQNTLEKDIAGAGSAKEQQKITEFMNQQMKILKSKNKLSKQDMLIAQKKYDILKAEMDLEDARNNKNTMKLTRGSDGNWSYQYVANIDDVLEKQQQVRDANNSLYVSMKSNFTSLTSDILSISQTANRRITEIVSEMDTADSERYAELEAEKQRLTDLYYGNNGILSQKYSEYLQARDELTQASGQSMLEFEDETVTQMANKWKDDPDSLKNSALNAYNSMSQAQANVAKQIEKATAAIGKNFSNVEASIESSTESARLFGEQVEELGEQTEGIYEMKAAVDVMKAAWYATVAAQVVSHFLSFDWVGGAAGAAALAAIIAGDIIGGISRFDTGGYTGDWGGDGKMAVLHEKELVLNKDDTANMLEAVSAVRDISSIGDSVAANVENGVSNIVANSLDLPNTDLSGNIDNSETSTNNTFEITMNVDGGDVEEIKDAILSLPTLASQYLSKNQK